MKAFVSVGDSVTLEVVDAEGSQTRQHTPMAAY